MATETKNKLSAQNLKNVLWDTLQSVKSGQLDSAQADSVASVSREILRTTALQLKISSQSKRDVPAEVISFSEN